ncbi:hypothetical protein FACS1894111_11370 [Clostridia bacterium]|nr:hypothetical protein FACS1894111_11370 [Clostridia bacterium]
MSFDFVADFSISDFSAEMVSIAKTKMPQANLIQHDFSLGIPQSLNDKKFNFIISTYAIHHLTDEGKISFISSLLELLEKDGILLIGDVSFKTRKNLEQCRQDSGEDWDNGEHYFVFDEIADKLRDTCSLQYHQLSYCAGVLEIGNPMLKGYLIPHPPLLVQGVGTGTEIPQTRAAYEQIGAEIAEYHPDVMVIISPHSVMYTDYFHISPNKSASGNFAPFGCPQVKFHVAYDSELTAKIAEFAEAGGIRAGFLGEKDKSLDHGVMVPLNFIKCDNIVRIGLSGFSFIEHYRFGMCIRQAIDALGRKAIIIASGDMSHKLGGSYGFSEYGVEHDKYVRESIEQSDVRRIFNIDPIVAENAAECGLRSIMILCGAFDGLNVHSSVLHYEAPFGVGYLTASFTADGETDSLLPLIITDKNSKLQAVRDSEDSYVKLARTNVENYVKTGKTITLSTDLPAELLNNQAGVFVSIKKTGNLRGCIGTIAPTCENIAAEIIQNGVSACSKDSRFDPISPDELDDLTYSVDVLNAPEPIDNTSQLDVNKYGVIVTSEYKRGLLLPNLDGVDTIDEQLSIAMQKGGIAPNENYSLERFEVVRHK